MGLIRLYIRYEIGTLYMVFSALGVIWVLYGRNWQWKILCPVAFMVLIHLSVSIFVFHIHVINSWCFMLWTAQCADGRGAVQRFYYCPCIAAVVWNVSATHLHGFASSIYSDSHDPARSHTTHTPYSTSLGRVCWATQDLIDRRFRCSCACFLS